MRKPYQSPGQDEKLILLYCPVGDWTHDLPHTVASNMVKVSHALNHSATEASSFFYRSLDVIIILLSCSWRHHHSSVVHLTSSSFFSRSVDVIIILLSFSWRHHRAWPGTTTQWAEARHARICQGRSAAKVWWGKYPHPVCVSHLFVLTVLWIFVRLAMIAHPISLFNHFCFIYHPWVFHPLPVTCPGKRFRWWATLVFIYIHVAWNIFDSAFVVNK